MKQFNKLATELIIVELTQELATSSNGVKKNALNKAIQIVKLYQKKEIENLMDANFLGYVTGVFNPESFDENTIINFYEDGEQESN